MLLSYISQQLQTNRERCKEFSSATYGTMQIPILSIYGLAVSILGRGTGPEPKKRVVRTVPSCLNPFYPRRKTIHVSKIKMQIFPDGCPLGCVLHISKMLNFPLCKLLLLRAKHSFIFLSCANNIASLPNLEGSLNINSLEGSFNIL